MKNKKTKIISIVFTALTLVIIALTCYVIINIIIAKKNNKPVNLFGSSISLVLTESMEPEIKAGDLIIFRICDFEDVKVGDNIVFVAGKGFDAAVQGKSVVHKVQSLTDEGAVTKGVNNLSSDKDLVTSENFLGICFYNSSFWGGIFLFFSKYGIFVIIFVIVLPFVISQVIKIVKLAKHGDGNDTQDDSAVEQDGRAATDETEENND